jgi:hypothetical protein
MPPSCFSACTLGAYKKRKAELNRGMHISAEAVTGVAADEVTMEHAAQGIAYMVNDNGRTLAYDKHVLREALVEHPIVKEARDHLLATVRGQYSVEDFHALMAT